MTQQMDALTNKISKTFWITFTLIFTSTRKKFHLATLKTSARGQFSPKTL